MTRQYIIYALLDPRTNMIKYIGKTTYNLKLRFRNHLNNAKKTKNKTKVINWIKSLSSKNLIPKIIDIEIFDNHDDLVENEKFYISYFNSLTNNELLNMTDGGEGCLGRIVSEKQKQHMSTIMTGKKHTEKTRIKMSNSFKGRVTTEKTRIKLRNRKDCKKVINLETLEIYSSLMETCRQLNVDSGYLCKVLNKKSYTICGYFLTYLPENIDNIQIWAKETLNQIKKQKEYKDLKKHQEKKIICTTTGKIYNSIKEAALELGCYPSSITSVCKKQRKMIYKLKFEYYNNEQVNVK